MARGTTPTLLPLDRWADIMGINPLSFNQLTSGLISVSDCGEVWFQRMWQNPDQASREDVADAIREAEEKISSEIGYFLLPDWVVDERIQTIRPARPEVFAGTVGNLRGMPKSLQPKWNFIISGGQKTKTLITAGVAVDGAALSDLDGDGYFETVTITVTVTAGDEPCEVRVFYPAAGVVPAAALDDWEVKPIRVTIVGTTATIVFKRWQIVDAELQARLNAEALDSTVDANYLTTVDVYRVFNDPQSMANLLWERAGPNNSCSTCSGSGCTACAFDTQTGCFAVRDERLGIVAYQPATWDSDDEEFNVANFLNCRDPDQLRLWYYAGWQSDNPATECPRVQMDPFFEKVVAYYAAAILDRDVCSCNNSERFIDHWREDLARVGSEVSFQISPEDLDNPLGTQRGAIYAWKQLKRREWRVHA